jgi:hypothetical protein
MGREGRVMNNEYDIEEERLQAEQEAEERRKQYMEDNPDWRERLLEEMLQGYGEFIAGVCEPVSAAEASRWAHSIQINDKHYINPSAGLREKSIH